MEPMRTDAIREQLQAFITKTFPLARKRNVGVDDRLLGEGIIDSLGVLDIVGHLEAQFHVQISDEDLTPENFETIGHMAAFVERKLAPAPIDTRDGAGPSVTRASNL
jgi:acyl carrier protein